MVHLKHILLTLVFCMTPFLCLAQGGNSGGLFMDELGNEFPSVSISSPTLTKFVGNEIIITLSKEIDFVFPESGFIDLDSLPLIPQLKSYLKGSGLVSLRPIAPSLFSARQQGVVFLEGSSLYRTYVATFASSMGIEAMQEKLMENKAVQQVSPNYFGQYYNITPPSDPYYPDQWFLHMSKGDKELPNIFYSWSFTSGSPDIRVGVMDSGIDYMHPDLGGGIGEAFKVVGGEDFLAPSSDPMDGKGHGTNVAGIIAASTNNFSFNGGSVAPIGVAGIAGGGYGETGVKLVALKVGGATGDPTIAACVSGLTKAILPPPAGYGCDVINMSLGFSGYSDSFHEAIKNVHLANVNLVCAGGNDPSNPVRFPAYFDYSWISAIGGQNEYGELCIGPNCHTYNGSDFASSFGPHLDVLAPCYNIFTTGIGGSYEYAYAGTSFASPMVAGALGLLRSLVSESFTSQSFLNMLNLSAFDPVDGNVFTKSDEYGHGILKVDNVLNNYSTFSMADISVPAQRVTQINTEPVNRSFSGETLNGVFPTWVYHVTAPVVFGTTYQGQPLIWGEGQTTTGYSLANPNKQMGYCRVIPSSVSPSGCSLETYIFKVKVNGEVSWYPVDPSIIVLSAKIWGEVDEKEKSKDNGIPSYQLATLTASPSPFNPTTRIKLFSPQTQKATLGVYDLKGCLIKSLFSGIIPQGETEFVWAGVDDIGKKQNSGVFFIRFSSPSGEVVLKTTLVK